MLNGKKGTTDFSMSVKVNLKVKVNCAGKCQGWSCNLCPSQLLTKPWERGCYLRFFFQEFLSLAKQVVDDETFRNRLASAGKKYVSSHHSPRVEKKTYESIVRTLMT